MDNKETLLARIASQSASKEESAAFRSFFEEISEEQVKQLLALDGFTTEYKIPIWNDEIGSPAHDPNKERDTPPDSYLKGKTTPRDIAEDLYILLNGIPSLEDIKIQLDAFAQLDETHGEYWQKISAILGPSNKLPSVSGRKAKKIDFPLDKVNASVWKLLENAKNGQIGIATEKNGSKTRLVTLYSINFDALGDDVSITRKLDVLDKRVYLAVSALYNAGNEIISLSQIYKTMGYTSRPNPRDIEKIANSISKMAAANVSLDNTQEASAYNYEKFVYTASLLPMERLEGVINGKAVEAAIHLFREPPLISFARGRKQITTIERKLLETPVNKTETNMLLEDYLIERIAHAKKGKLSAKILYKTLYDEARITTKKQRQRVTSKLEAILGHYVQCGFIRGYSDAGDGVIIDL